MKDLCAMIIKIFAVCIGKILILLCWASKVPWKHRDDWFLIFFIHIKLTLGSQTSYFFLIEIRISLKGEFFRRISQNRVFSSYIKKIHITYFEKCTIAQADKKIHKHTHTHDISRLSFNNRKLKMENYLHVSR